MEEGLKLKGRVRLWFHDAKTGELVDFFEKDNLIVTTGKVAVARRLVGNMSIANTGEITYIAVGDDPTVPTVADTLLGNETFRKILALREFTSNVARLRGFFGTTEANGTLRELALFGENATASANSGTMFNRLIINKIKTSSNTLTLEVEITVG